MPSITSLITLAFGLFVCKSSAFSPIARPALADRQFTVEPLNSHEDASVDRRSFFNTIALSSFAIVTANKIQPAYASGGATAGGAYLLSAKQRYNERVIKGITAFLALESSLKSGNFDEAVAFFSGDEAGTWKDASAAGYLLANAFRRNSSKAPDSLPSVKAWKKFAAEVEALNKSVSKKKAKPALESFMNAKEALVPYLEEVDLTSAVEI